MNQKQRKRRHQRRQAHSPGADQPRNTLNRERYSTVKQGHIVPATYQRNFAREDEVVSVHVKGRDACIPMHVKKAGTRSRFYRRLRPDGTPIDDFEATLAEAEGKAGPVLREVADGAELSAERKGVLAQFFGVQMLRGPAFFTNRHESIATIIREELRPEHLRPGVLEAAGGDFSAVREKVIQLYRQPTQALMTMGTSSAKVAAVLGGMRWQLLRFDDPVVAYSDQPVVLWPLDIREFAEPPSQPLFGPREALEIRIPLSSHLAVLMTWADRADPTVLVRSQPAVAAEMNASVVAQADKQWMHTPGREPPIAAGPFRPLSEALEPGYSPAAARASHRRAAVTKALPRVRNKRFLNDIPVITGRPA